MSNDGIEARMWEVPFFAIGMWLLPNVIGYVLVGGLVLLDVCRWFAGRGAGGGREGR